MEDKANAELTNWMKEKYEVTSYEELGILLNDQTLDQLHMLYNDRMSFLKKSTINIQKTFFWIKSMSIIAYIMGIILIIFPLYYYVRYEQRIELLGFNALGTAEILAVLWYKPMQRVQDALGDFQQNMLILHSWSTQVGLFLYSMNIDEKEVTSEKSVWKTCENIHKITLEYLTAIQKYTETLQLAKKGLQKVETNIPSGDSESKQLLNMTSGQVQSTTPQE